MNTSKIFLLASLSLLITLTSFSQIEIGTWREHFSYKKATCVVDAEDKVYVAGELAIFSYDKSEGLMEKLSKVNGLSDAEIQTIAFNKSNNTLVIAYKNSNIDILKNDIVYNLTEIKRKQISHNKTINKISFVGNTAYLSCGFGIVALNTDKKEIIDTYYIGDNSSYKNINDVSLFNNKLYAATDEGLFSANYNTNLTDYRNWQLDISIPNNNFKSEFLNVFNNHLFVGQYSSTSRTYIIYKFKNNIWDKFKSGIWTLKTIENSKNTLIVISYRKAYFFDTSLNEIKKIDTYPFINEESTERPSMYSGVVDDNSNVFIADRYYGLIHDISGNLEFLYPNGPTNNTTAKAKFVSEKLITTNGNSRMSAWHAPEYNIFENEEWKTFGITKDTARNFYSIAVNPNNPNNVFIGAFAYGIFEFNKNNWNNHFHNFNSSLQSIPGFGTGYDYIRITGLEFDKNNNLWATNHMVAEPISVKTENNEWQSFNFNGLITDFLPDKLIVTEDNNKWILLGESRGLLVLDDNNTPLNKDDDSFKKFSPTESNGDLISNSVTAIDQDKDGNVWIGTDDGVAIYYSPEKVFEDHFYADRIQLTSYGNDTTEQYLFKTAIVVDVETDGANRKWIATKNSGIFLVSDNGKEEIANFNIYNSPLISNTINDIAINQISGEVFILTNKGILSYRSDATFASEDFNNVYVFPNPIRPDYSGKITVTGLADEVIVKFTDISGNVIYETASLGGQAIWNGKTFDGRKVSSGVYLIFSTNEDGSKTQISKLLFMN